MRLDLLSTSPLVVRYYDFVTDAEAAHLVRVSAPLFVRSTVVCDKPGGRCVDQWRTSESAYLPQDNVTRAIQKRAMALARRPKCEDLQVVRYRVGQEYKPHMDQFDPRQAEGAKQFAAGGQRRATFLVYLRCPEAGGGTVFPELGLDVPPIANSAVYWSHQLADGVTSDPKTLHGGAPVLRGEKLAANVWLR